MPGLEAIKENSESLSSLLSLTPEERKDVMQYANIKKKLTETLAASSESVRRVLAKHDPELKVRIEALSSGRLDLPLEESPLANYEIIETFGGRMDAVSRDDLSFWEDDLGKRYLSECTKARGNCQFAELSRIFVLHHKSIANDRNRLVNILKKHLEAKIGFAIVMEESLQHDFRMYHHVREDGDAENRNGNVTTTLDFALFSRDMALTSFRNREKSSSINGKSRSRFKALFRAENGENPNNRVLQMQRRLWVDLIAQAWLVSSNFMPIVATGISSEEEKRIKEIAWAGTQRVMKETQLHCDDEYFPLVVKENADLADLELKLQQLHTHYKPSN